MSLSCGIVGLPNVGKSTLFNALMKRDVAQTANYPFTTIKPHKGVVPVKDDLLDKLSSLIKPEKTVEATVTFVDIAGLVKNAHKGEGLGNEFLGQIRNVDAIVHVIRSFVNKNVTHVMGSVDIERDKQIIENELMVADINKPVIEWINSSLDDFEKMDKLIKDAYVLLKLISFYTIKGGKEVRGWAMPRGSNVIEAAGRVHTDFAERFIKAQVVGIRELLTAGSWLSAREKGKIRIEGKDYIVKENDVIEFLVGK